MEEQKIKFNLDNVDITDIMSQIHENLKKRGYDVNELNKLSRGIRIPTPTAECVDIAPTLGALTASAHINCWWPMPAVGGVMGKIKLFIKKVMRKLTFFYLKHVTDQQNIFNNYAVNSVNILNQKCAKLEEENNELMMKITALYNNNATLSENFEKLNKESVSKAREYAEKAEELERTYALRQNELDAVLTTLSARLSKVSSEAIIKPHVEISKEFTAEIIKDTEGPHQFDYFLFESKYRGTSEEIKKRQKRYLKYFEGKENVLDIGCGRGEFLQLLSENGISAKGIDMQSENIDCCREKGIDAVLGDGIKYLATVSDNSLGGIFCAQVIEHLSNEQLIEFIRLAHKKLQPEAKIIMETLNPQCLMIYAESFYMDPSHTKPVHPYVVKFIAECEGFTKNNLEFMTPSDDSMQIPLTAPLEDYNHAFSIINTLLFGNREYALIAEK